MYTYKLRGALEPKFIISCNLLNKEENQPQKRHSGMHMHIHLLHRQKTRRKEGKKIKINCFVGNGAKPLCLSLGSKYEIVVHCFTHFEKPVSSQCKFFPPGAFHPVLPSVGSGAAIDSPFSIIHVEQGVNPCAVSVEARVYCDVVLEVKLVDLAIYPV